MRISSRTLICAQWLLECSLASQPVGREEISGYSIQQTIKIFSIFSYILESLNDQIYNPTSTNENKNLQRKEISNKAAPSGCGHETGSFSVKAVLQYVDDWYWRTSQRFGTKAPKVPAYNTLCE